jgi:hypothetical protein
MHVSNYFKFITKLGTILKRSLARQTNPEELVEDAIGSFDQISFLLVSKWSFDKIYNT